MVSSVSLLGKIALRRVLDNEDFTIPKTLSAHYYIQAYVYVL